MPQETFTPSTTFCISSWQQRNVTEVRAKLECCQFTTGGHIVIVCQCMYVNDLFMANSHILCRSHAFSLPCRSAKCLDCVVPIWFTQCGHVLSHMPCRSPAMPRICCSESDLSRLRHSAAWERHGMCELASAVQRRHVGDLSEFGFFRPQRGVPRKLLSKAYQSQMQVASVKPSNVRHGQGESYYFGTRTRVLV
jgi:hypothetical protein